MGVEVFIPSLHCNAHTDIQYVTEDIEAALGMP